MQRYNILQNYLFSLFIRFTTTLTIMSFSSVRLSAIIRVRAFYQVVFQHPVDPLAETSAVYRFYYIAYGDDYIKIVQDCFIYLVCVFTHMCNFCTCDIGVKFSLFKTVLYMATNYGSVSSEQLCHLACCQPHCVFLEFYFQLCLSILALIKYD